MEQAASPQTREQRDDAQESLKSSTSPCRINVLACCLLVWPGSGSRTRRSSIAAENKRWEQRDLNPPQRISSETAHQMGSLQDCNGSALQLVINFSKPTRRHSRATGARDTTKLYYTPVIHRSASVLGLSARTLSASQLLLAPLPTLVTGFFPSTGPSLHGEQASDLPSLYESIVHRRTAFPARFDTSPMKVIL